MSEFLERHRKKSLLGVLLLIFKRGKGTGPLLVLVGLMSFIFVLPAGLLGLNVPWAHRLAKQLGLNKYWGDDGERLARFSDTLRDARSSGRAEPTLWRRFASGAGSPERSTVDMVKPQEQEKLKGDDEKYVTGGGKSVSGVLTPEDTKKADQGVQVDPAELEHGLMKSAYAGMLPGGAGDAKSLRKGAAMDSRMSLAKGSLGASEAPGVGAAGKAGDLSKFNWNKHEGTLTKGAHLTGGKGTNGWRSLLELATSRAYSTAAAAPKCTGACPKEYASNTAAVTFDGTRSGEQILTVPELGETNPVLPDSSNLGVDQANKLEADMKQCQDAQNQYGPEERRLMDKIQKDAQQSQSQCQGGCGGGCQQSLRQEQSDCQAYNAVAQKIDAACKAIGGGSTQISCS